MDRSKLIQKSKPFVAGSLKILVRNIFKLNEAINIFILDPWVNLTLDAVYPSHTPAKSKFLEAARRYLNIEEIHYFYFPIIDIPFDYIYLDYDIKNHIISESEEESNLYQINLDGLKVLCRKHKNHFEFLCEKTDESLIKWRMQTGN